MFSLLETPRNLIKAALGEIKADIIIEDTKLVSVVTGEILENNTIVIYNGYIVRVGRIDNVEKYIGSKTIRIDGSKYYALPGFIDGHVHIESSLLRVTEFGRLAIKHGTTTVIADPHEIGNVLGIDGVKYFIEESRYTPLRIFFDVPSCVPAVDPSFSLDTPGAIIDAGQIAVLMQDPSVIGLGEVMDMLSVLQAKLEVLSKIASARLAGKTVDGHAPLLRDEALDAYLCAGISSDHESTSTEEGLEKLRKGMYVMLREGSAWKDLGALSKLVTEHNIDCRRCLLVTDDISVEDLVEKGYLDYVVNLAIEYGIDPVKAIQMATINPAEHFKLDDRLGIIAPGRYADIVLSPSIEKIVVDKVFVNGDLVYGSGEWLYKTDGIYRYPEKAYKTIRIKRIPEPEDLLIKVDARKGFAEVNVIQAMPGSSLTKWVKGYVPIDHGYLKADIDDDILHIAVIERHHATGNIGKGFVKGFKLARGAIAQTIAHDTHNLIVVGTNPYDMAVAIKRIVEIGGGITIVVDGKEEATIKLPIAGLVSDENYEAVYKELKHMEEVSGSLGINFNNIHMTLGLIALPVIPELRITDKGLVDVMNGRIVEPIISIKNY